MLALDLFERGVHVPGVRLPFSEGVTIGAPQLSVTGGRATRATEEAASRFHQSNFRSDWQGTTGSSDAGMAWLFGEEN